MKKNKNKSQNHHSKEGSTLNETSEVVVVPDDKIIVKFITTSQLKIQIQIEPEKKMRDLIMAYFTEIKRPELFEDPNIRFIVNAKLIEHNSNELVKNNIKKDANTVVIDDLEEKIK